MSKIHFYVCSASEIIRKNLTLVTVKGFTVKVHCGVEDEYTRQPPLSKPLLCLLGLGEVVKAGGGRRRHKDVISVL